jgi:hypothetical protein
VKSRIFSPRSTPSLPQERPTREPGISVARPSGRLLQARPSSGLLAIPLAVVGPRRLGAVRPSVACGLLHGDCSQFLTRFRRHRNDQPWRHGEPRHAAGRAAASPVPSPFGEKWWYVHSVFDRYVLPLLAGSCAGNCSKSLTRSFTVIATGTDNSGDAAQVQELPPPGSSPFREWCLHGFFGRYVLPLPAGSFPVISCIISHVCSLSSLQKWPTLGPHGARARSSSRSRLLLRPLTFRPALIRPLRLPAVRSAVGCWQFQWFLVTSLKRSSAATTQKRPTPETRGTRFPSSRLVAAPQAVARPRRHRSVRPAVACWLLSSACSQLLTRRSHRNSQLWSQEPGPAPGAVSLGSQPFGEQWFVVFNRHGLALPSGSCPVILVASHAFV